MSRGTVSGRAAVADCGFQNVFSERSGHRICPYVYVELEKKLAARGEFSKINDRNSFISVGCEFGRITQMNDLLERQIQHPK